MNLAIQGPTDTKIAILRFPETAEATMKSALAFLCLLSLALTGKKHKLPHGDTCCSFFDSSRDPSFIHSEPIPPHPRPEMRIPQHPISMRTPQDPTPISMRTAGELELP